MNSRDRDLDSLFDQALDEIKSDAPPAEEARAAEERVWQRLHAEAAAGGASTIRSCADFQRLLPAYVRRELGDSRMLLLQDHLGECVPCRRVFRDQRRAGPSMAAPAAGRRAGSFSRWATRVAAAAVVFIAIVGVSVKTDVFSFETGGLIHVERVQGELFRVTEAGIVPLLPGETLTLDEGQGVRTAKDSTAMLRLADDSRVEMRERSELAVQSKRSLLPGRRADGVIDLTRGSVIVDASDQGSGHLFLRTEDCKVSVTGTVFTVNHGVKGSRVSVIEGEVHVDHSGTQDRLHAGQQTTTGSALARVPVDQEIAWSTERERHLALLREFRALSEEIDQVFRPGLRYSTQLLELAPAGTVVYFAMPNLSGELGEAYGVLRARIADNALLRDWWTEHVTPEAADRLEQTIGKIAVYGEHLGKEVAMTLQLGPGPDEVGPLFLAKLDHPAAFTQLIAGEIRHEGAEEHVHLIEGELPASMPTHRCQSCELIFWVREGLLAVSDDLGRLHALARALGDEAGALPADSSFREQLADAYDHGVEWLVGVDVARLMRPDDEDSREVLERLGMLDAQTLIGERRQIDDHTENRVVLSFSQPRRKLAAWLDEPAPLGALDYVSPEANLVVGFAMKDMDVVVGELFELLAAVEPGFERELQGFESEHGIDVRRDVAAALGGEFVVALDGPILPKPAAALVVEVYDRTRLQQTLAWIVETVNEQAAAHGLQGLLLETSTVGAHEFHRVYSHDTGLEVHYTFDGGYGLFATSQAQLHRVLANRAMGVRLTDSPKFLALLPRDGQADFSGLFYHDLAPVLGPLADVLGLSEATADAQFLAAAGEAHPMLAVFYGERDRIVATSMSQGGLFASSFGSLSGLGGLLATPQRLLERVNQAPEQPAQPEPVP